jgi:hypothetical protein
MQHECSSCRSSSRLQTVAWLLLVPAVVIGNLLLILFLLAPLAEHLARTRTPLVVRVALEPPPAAVFKPPPEQKPDETADLLKNLSILPFWKEPPDYDTLLNIADAIIALPSPDGRLYVDDFGRFDQKKAKVGERYLEIRRNGLRDSGLDRRAALWGISSADRIRRLSQQK